MITCKIQLRYVLSYQLIWVTITSAQTVIVCTCGVNYLDKLELIITKRYIHIAANEVTDIAYSCRLPFAVWCDKPLQYWCELVLWMRNVHNNIFLHLSVGVFFVGNGFSVLWLDTVVVLLFIEV